MNTIPFFGKEFNTFIPVVVLLFAGISFTGEKKHHRKRRESEVMEMKEMKDVEVRV